MSLRNANIYSHWIIDKYNKYLAEKPITKGLRKVLDKLADMPDGLSLIELPANNGRFLKLLREHVGFDKFKSITVYEHRRRLFEQLSELPVDSFRQNVFADKEFKKQSVDLLLCIDHLDNEVKPVEWLNGIIGKINAKEIFVVFDLGPEMFGKDLLEENIRTKELFPTGKYVRNRYNEKALNEIAKQTGLALEILRDSSGDSAILYKSKKDAVIEESEPVAENKEEPESKPKGKGKGKGNKKDKGKVENG